MDHSLILALATEVTDPAGATAFWSTPIGEFLKYGLGALGVLIVALGFLKGIPKALNGKMPEAVKIIFGCILIAVICFKPELINTMITVAGDIFSKVLDSLKSFSK